VLAIPTSASSGTLTLLRSDGTSVVGGAVTLTSAAAAGRVAAVFLPPALKPPALAVPPGPVPTTPRSSPTPSAARLTQARRMAPLVDQLTLSTTPVELSPFLYVGVAVLIAAFLLGFANATRLTVYSRRSRR